MNDQNEVKLQSTRRAIQTVQCIVVSFEILTIQAVKFVEFCDNGRVTAILFFINAYSDITCMRKNLQSQLSLQHSRGLITPGNQKNLKQSLLQN